MAQHKHSKLSMKKSSSAFLFVLLGSCLLATVAYSQPMGVSFNYNEESIPNTHTVVEGDTLYDLSGTYLNDVLLWPKLWSYNPQITNPHWIYPGDIIKLKANIPSEPVVVEDLEDTPRKVTNWVVNREFVPLIAILSEDEVKSYGEIVASSRDASLLKKNDFIWIKGNPEAPTQPKLGEYYIVYHETDDDIPTDAYGERKPYTVVGVIQIAELSKRDKSPYLGGRIVYSTREIERGDSIIPYKRQSTDIKIDPAQKDLAGQIIYSVTPRTQLSEYNYVFINRGTNDGVRIGNRFFVYQSGDEYLVDRGKEIEDIPMKRVGQLLVLAVDKDTSLAVVIHSKKEFEVGDRVEMYKGY